ncbi:MAG TPA: hypothetical protein PLN31_20930 [Azoarcus taiwanensis]|nr:hypothetical protein [Azoarcus taiwanensis]
MRNRAVFLLLAWLLTGCVTYHSPIPEGYAGPRATVRDSVVTHSMSKADFFYVSQVDGQKIEDSLINTRVANHGRGLVMTPYLIERDIPAHTAALVIVGRTHYAAPILALTSTVYEVKGNVQLSAKAGTSYVVRGELGESYSAVWIEDDAGVVVPGTKVEVDGSAKLGFFEK